MSTNQIDKFSAWKIKILAEKTGISYMKVYHNLSGVYNSLTDQEKRKLYNAMYDEFELAASALGFTSDGRGIKPK